MKIVIAGGSGFLGTALRKHFEHKNYEVKVLSRRPVQSFEIKWDAKTLGNWTQTIDGADVLINLTGKSVDCRYNATNKQAILSSRLLSTQVLQEAIDRCAHPPQLWINSSSATIYIHATSQLMDEYRGIIGDDFSMNVCKAWETAFFEKPIKGVRKVAVRSSIVLGNEGGAFPKIKMLTKAFLGGFHGDGQQMMSWIHIRDFCRAVEHIIDDKEIDGAVNVTAPQPISNNDFMALMRQKYKRRFGLNQSKLMLELGAFIIVTETELLLKSRNVYPEKLLLQGFQFLYPKAKDALNAL